MDRWIAVRAITMYPINSILDRNILTPNTDMNQTSPSELAVG